MFTRQIPKQEWPSFLNDFSQKHRGWPVRLEVINLDLGDQIEMENAPLVGVVADDSSISVLVGERSQQHVGHSIRGVQKIWLDQNDERNDVALQIDSGDGTKTLLTFRHVMDSHLLDRGVE